MCFHENGGIKGFWLLEIKHELNAERVKGDVWEQQAIDYITEMFKFIF